MKTVPRVLGAILAIVVLTELFYLRPEDRQALTFASPVSAGSPEFMTALSRLLDAPLEQGPSVQVIGSGKEFASILIKELDAASSSIDFTTYPWSNGVYSNEVFDALTKAASRGVAVRVLIDALGGHTAPQALVDSLKKAGGDVRTYHSFDIWDPIEFDSRDHVRSIVIDGKVGFLGGVGIGDLWLGDGVTSGWGDMMFKVTDTMAQSLQSAFSLVWHQATGEVLAGPLFYPPIKAAGSQSQSEFIGIASAPSDSSEPIRDAFLASIDAAQKKLSIVNPFIVPDRGILDALEARAKAGVDVRIISPGKNTYAPLIRYAWQGDYAELLAAGVHIYEYDPVMIHTKFLTADDVWSVIGSANLDTRSQLLNDENVMGIRDPLLAGDLEQTFAADASNSTEIVPSMWAKRGLWSKLVSSLMLFFSKQL